MHKKMLLVAVIVRADVWMLLVSTSWYDPIYLLHNNEIPVTGILLYLERNLTKLSKPRKAAVPRENCRLVQ